MTDLETCGTIRFRRVANDAVVGPWVDMPEVQPSTISGLITYLRNDRHIHPEPLAFDGWRGEGTVLRYGLRKQFWIPGEVTDEERALVESWGATPKDIGCPICGEALEFASEPTAFGETSHHAECRHCGLRFASANGAWTSRETADAITDAISNGSSALTRKITRMRKALEPFSRCAEIIDAEAIRAGRPPVSGQEILSGESASWTITAADMREARDASQ